MSAETPPLLDLFTCLRDHARLPLGIREYQLLLSALEGGFGLSDRESLKRLCETLWTKNDEEKQQLAYHFDRIIPVTAETTTPLENKTAAKKHARRNRTFAIFISLFIGIITAVGLKYCTFQTVAPPPDTPSSEPTQNPEGAPTIAPSGVATDSEPTPADPQQNKQPDSSQQNQWIIVGVITFPLGLLLAWMLIRWWLRHAQPLQETSSSSGFSKATQIIQDEIEATQINQSLHQHRQNRFLMTRHYLPLTQRQMKRSWRYLSRPVRTGTPTELDVEATVQRIGQQGLFIDPVLVPPRTNRAVLLLLIDQDGSMVTFHRLTERLATTARRGGRFSQTYVYYFHNCPAGCLYRDAICLDDESLEQIFETLPLRQLSTLIVSDAGAVRNGYNPYRVEATKAFLAMLSARVRYVAWLNPLPKQRWSGNTAGDIAQMVPMFGCDRSGLDEAIEVLRGRKHTVTLEP